MLVQHNYLFPAIKKIKNAFNQTRYGEVYDYKESLNIGSQNNWIITNFLDDRTYDVEYECINRNILDGNIMNIYLINYNGNHGAIDDDDTSCHGYYTIIFYAYTYTLQEDLNIDVQVLQRDLDTSRSEERPDHAVIL